MRRRARKSDGANMHGRSRYNEHTGQCYIPGDHWVECQRCGFDVRESNSKREWNGNIVCEGCWDPRQPQDFVRGVYDDIAAKGNVRPAGESTSGLGTGSTSVPGGTFFSMAYDIGTIPDQANDAGDTITTITGAVFPATIEDIYGQDSAITGYRLTNAPGGASIDSSGDITGTLTDESFSDSPYGTAVVATYGTGQELSAPFAWTVAEVVGRAPDELSTDICGWYDFSTLDDSYDNADGLTNIVDGAVIRRQNSKNGTGANFPDNWLVSSVEAYESPWNSDRQNGLGAWIPHTGSPSNAGDLSSNNPFNPVVLPVTIVGVIKCVSGTGADRYWFGSDVSQGMNIGISQNAEGSAPQLESQKTNPTPGQTITTGSVSHNTYAGDWQMWLVEMVTDTTTTIEINNQTMPGGAIAHNHMNQFTGIAIGNQNINGFTWPYYGWGDDIGEVIVFCGTLSESDKAALFEHMRIKWQLSSYP